MVFLVFLDSLKLYIVASPLYASTFTQSIFIGTGKSFYSSNIPSDFMVYQSSVPCNLTSNRGKNIDSEREQEGINQYIIIIFNV